MRMLWAAGAATGFSIGFGDKPNKKRTGFDIMKIKPKNDEDSKAQFKN